MSTYRQPGTPDVGGVGKQMEAIQSIANVFIDANKLKIKLNNEKTKRIQKENAEILKEAEKIENNSDNKSVKKRYRKRKKSRSKSRKYHR